jgi:hypothetical protein
MPQADPNLAARKGERNVRSLVALLGAGAEALKESSRGGVIALEDSAHPERAPALMVWWADVESGHYERWYLWLRIPRPGAPCNDSGGSRDGAEKRS